MGPTICALREVINCVKRKTYTAMEECADVPLKPKYTETVVTHMALWGTFMLLISSPTYLSRIQNTFT